MSTKLKASRRPVVMASSALGRFCDSARVRVRQNHGRGVLCLRASFTTSLGWPSMVLQLYVRRAAAGFNVIAIHACRAPAIAAVVKDTKSAKAKAQKANGVRSV